MVRVTLIAGDLSGQDLFKGSSLRLALDRRPGMK